MLREGVQSERGHVSSEAERPKAGEVSVRRWRLVLDIPKWQWAGQRWRSCRADRCASRDPRNINKKWVRNGQRWWGVRTGGSDRRYRPSIVL